MGKRQKKTIQALEAQIEAQAAQIVELESAIYKAKLEAGYWRVYASAGMDAIIEEVLDEERQPLRVDDISKHFNSPWGGLFEKGYTKRSPEEIKHSDFYDEKRHGRVKGNTS